MKKILTLLLLLPLAIFAQDVETRVKEKLASYYQSHLPLKVNLILSRESVFAGDTIFFRADVLTADQLLPLAGTTILNVFLQDKNDNMLVRSSIRLNDGFGRGQFIIPQNIPDGKYTVVAYHDWMKNDTEALYFRKSIWVGSLQHDKLQVKLSFHAEGGSLVAGVSNKIIVIGKPKTRGSIKKASSETVVQFTIDKDGIGFFFLTPVMGENYTAFLDGERDATVLPDVKEDGLTVLASLVENGGTLRVLLQAPLHSVIRSKRIFAVMTMQSHIFYSANFVMGDKPFVQLSIPLQNALPGIGVMKLYDETEKVLAERLVAVPEREPVTAEIVLTQNTFLTRDKINVGVSLKNDLGTPVVGNCAVSVIHAGIPPADSSSQNVVNNILYFSDLDEGHPNLLHSKSATDFAKFNNYLVSKKWLRQGGELKVSYLANDLMLSGEVVREKNKDLPDSTLITFFFQKSASSYQWLLEDGKFKFPLLFDFEGVEDVYYKVTDHGRLIKDARVILDDPYDITSLNSSDAVSGFAGQRNLINRSYDFYMHGPRYENPGPQKTELEDLMSGADITINLDDYILFPTMSETLREIIPSVQHRVVKGRNEVRVFLDDVNLLAKVEPAFVIDGIVVDDVDYFLNLKPADVSSIKVVYAQNKIAQLGVVADGGIVIVETKITDHAKTIRASANRFLLSGLTQPMTFKEKTHTKSTSRIPDLRTTLYWNPAVGNESHHFSFHASDITGDYVIRIEGVTANGKPFYTEKKFSVVFAKGN